MTREALQALMAAILDSGNLTTAQVVERAEQILKEVEARYFRATKKDLRWQ